MRPRVRMPGLCQHPSVQLWKSLLSFLSLSLFRDTMGKWLSDSQSLFQLKLWCQHHLTKRWALSHSYTLCHFSKSSPESQQPPRPIGTHRYLNHHINKTEFSFPNLSPAVTSLAWESFLVLPSLLPPDRHQICPLSSPVSLDSTHFSPPHQLCPSSDHSIFHLPQFNRLNNYLMNT